jgi:hypothetical protein
MSLSGKVEIPRLQAKRSGAVGSRSECRPTDQSWARSARLSVFSRLQPNNEPLDFQSRVVQLRRKAARWRSRPTYAFAWLPPFAQGVVRDLRVRWTLEESGIAYTTRLIGGDERGAGAYRALQPFGQIPVLVKDGQALFESGTIALHVAERSGVLLPADPRRRAVATGWVFAALDTIEGASEPLVDVDLFHAEGDWARARRPAAASG